MSHLQKVNGHSNEDKWRNDKNDKQTFTASELDSIGLLSPHELHPTYYADWRCDLAMGFFEFVKSFWIRIKLIHQLFYASSVITKIRFGQL